LDPEKHRIAKRSSSKLKMQVLFATETRLGRPRSTLFPRTVPGVPVTTTTVSTRSQCQTVQSLNAPSFKYRLVKASFFYSDSLNPDPDPAYQVYPDPDMNPNPFLDAVTHPGL
jgi:hypothetical protein